MRQNTNIETFGGYLYEAALELKTAKSEKNAGKPYISGTIDIATDEECANIIQVHFTYVTPTTAKGNNNATYVALSKIMNEGKTVAEHGKENATKVAVDRSALSLNDFFVKEASAEGGYAPVSQKRNEGGYVSIITELPAADKRNSFKIDTVIMNVHHVDADPEKNINEAFTELRGFVFDFRNSIMPVTFVVRNPKGMAFFESLDVTPSEPYYTQLRGFVNNKSIVVTKTEESAFGEAYVESYERKVREWVVTSAAKVPYEFGEENVLTLNDISTAMKNRQVALSEIKQRRIDYDNSKNSSVDTATANASTISNFMSDFQTMKNTGFSF